MLSYAIIMPAKLIEMVDIQIIGGGILTAKDLLRLNEEEVRTRKYKYCTIDAYEMGTFLAKVAYSESSKSWEPTEIEYYGKWISPDEFDSTKEGGSYSCVNYRFSA